MTPATTHAHAIERAAAAAAGLTIAPSPCNVATISTPDGRAVARGTLEIDGRATPWRGTLHQIDRPGVIASLYFAEGVREVVVRMADGRRARARLSGTRFAGSERVCQLTGIEPLA